MKGWGLRAYQLCAYLSAVFLLVMLGACQKPAEPEDPRVPVTPSPRIEEPADKDVEHAR